MALPLITPCCKPAKSGSGYKPPLMVIQSPLVDTGMMVGVQKCKVLF